MAARRSGRASWTACWASGWENREVLNGFVWRFLFSRSVIQNHGMHFLGAYLEDELFLLEYFCYANKLAMTDKAVYHYLQNPASVTRRYLPDYMQTFHTFMKAKEALAQRLELGRDQPLWRENSCWAGLLIAVGNEFAASNAAPWRKNAAGCGASASCRKWPRPSARSTRRGWGGTSRSWQTSSAAANTSRCRCSTG